MRDHKVDVARVAVQSASRCAAPAVSRLLLIFDLWWLQRDDFKQRSKAKLPALTSNLCSTFSFGRDTMKLASNHAGLAFKYVLQLPCFNLEQSGKNGRGHGREMELSAGVEGFQTQCC